MKGLHVDDGGVGGLPVVLHHGLGADLEVWREMLGPLARPQTRRLVLQSVARMDLPAFASLRASVLEVAPARSFAGPKFAIDAEGNDDNPRMASRLPGVKQRKISGVSHWLMLDDPPAFNAALDEALQ